MSAGSARAASIFLLFFLSAPILAETETSLVNSVCDSDIVSPEVCRDDVLLHGAYMIASTDTVSTGMPDMFMARLPVDAASVYISEALAAHRPPFSNGVYRAVVIGNNKYRDKFKLWKPLKTAASDAQAVANLLKNEYGFADVRLLLNATRKDILNALTDLRFDIAPEDHVLIYYAGHGHMDEETGEAYWIPVDAEGDDDTTFVANERVRKKLEVLSSKVKHTLIISDSCFSASLFAQRRGVRLGKKTEEYIRKKAVNRSAQIIAAGGLQYVDDVHGKTGHSPFTFFLLDELKKNREQYLTTSELALNVTKQVSNNANQTPESGTLAGVGDEGGEFIFRKVTSQPSLALKEQAEKDKTVPLLTAAELEFWQFVKEKNDPDLFALYIKKYPNGQFVELAQFMLKGTALAKLPEPTPAAVTPAVQPAPVKVIKMEKRDTSVKRLLLLAQEEFEDHNYKQAYNYWQEVLDAEPANDKASTGVGRIGGDLEKEINKRMKKRDYRRAASLLRQAVAIYPDKVKFRKLKKQVDRKLERRTMPPPVL